MMVEFAQLDKKETKNLLDNATKKELLELFDYFEEFLDFKKKHKKHALNLETKSKRVTATKHRIVLLFVDLFTDSAFKMQLNAKLMKTALSSYLYHELVWESAEIATQRIEKEFHYPFTKFQFTRYYETKVERLTNNLFADNLSLVYREVRHSYEGDADFLHIHQNIREILKLVIPIPKNFLIHEEKEPFLSQYSYNNEAGVVSFIPTIHSLLESNLVALNATGIKPLTKTLNLLQSTSGVSEFYQERKLHTLATDMLTRTMHAYYKREKKAFAMPPQQLLKQAIRNLFEGKLDFMISRILLMHLKKVRYDEYYQNEKELFFFAELIINNMPQNGFVSMKNILDFAKYRNIEVDIDRRHKRDEYYMDAKILIEDTLMEDRFYAYTHYRVIMFDPLIKGLFFYLGALGVMELRYSDPLSPYNLSQLKEPYISVWDSLDGVKLTDLGRYVFGMSKKYIPKEEDKSRQKEIYFDSLKPIIRIDKSDVIMQAKLEAFCDKIGEGKYALSYTKIFKDIPSKKGLEQKIEQFYKQIESNPPKVFQDYFEELLLHASLLKRESKQMVLQLSNNKKLLQLFMQNKKLREFTIKAEGYRIIVLKENLAKVTKIVKEHGFFVEF